MYQNAIYICISWYSKIWWFSVKKWWCQQNPRGMLRDSYIFWIFFRWGITVSSFIIAGYAWQILGRGTFLPPLPHPRASPKNSILNRVNNWQHCNMIMSWNRNITILTYITNWFPPFVNKNWKDKKSCMNFEISVIIQN